MELLKDGERAKTMIINKRDKSKERVKARVEKLQRERTIVAENNLRREKTFAERAQNESMETLATQLESEAKGRDKM